jgi:large subunit ribosomal protein L6
VKVSGQNIALTGLEVDPVYQSAANIEQASKIKNLDPRVFQDGIYITVKDGKPVK